MARITPTVGRIVHLYNTGNSNPIPAIVTAVDGDWVAVCPFNSCMVTGTNAPPRAPGEMILSQVYGPGEYKPAKGENAENPLWHAEWMPYQMAQAEKK